MPRLFTAVELSLATKSAIAVYQADIASTLRERSAAVRLVRADQLHLTLVFIGPVNDWQATAIGRVMADDLPQSAFEVEFGPVGVFPINGPARVLWIGVTRGVRELTDVCTAVAERLEYVGVPSRRRPYAPHLTIGRWRGGQGPSRVELFASGVRVVERVSTIALYESHLRPSGADHVLLARTTLGGHNALH